MSVEDLLYERKMPTSKRNYVGIEIECRVPYDNLDTLSGLLIKNNLQWNVDLGDDSSIDTFDEELAERIQSTWETERRVIRRDSWGNPEYAPNLHEIRNRFNHVRFEGKELRILAEESEMPEIIDKVCGILESLKCNVNDSCGLHVHVDMRNRDKELVYNNFFYVQNLMFSTQPAARRRNTYCEKNTSSAFPRNAGRRRAINTEAYKEHRTIEIRLHEGSINAKEIKMWVGFLLKVANMKTKLSKTVKTFDSLSLPAMLEGYMNARVKKYL